MDRFPGLPPNASAHGSDIDLLIGLVHLFSILFFLGWGIYLLVTLVRFRSSKQKKARYGGVKGWWVFISIMTVVVVELVLDFGFSVPIWSHIAEDIPDEADATVVRIVAEQFAWNIHYPGPDGIFGTTRPDLVGPENPLGLDRTDPSASDDITTVNRLMVPVGRPVLIYLTSKDVIHSLFLPAFRVKQDAVPGLTSPVWFIPTKTTEEIRREMTVDFDVSGAVSTESSIDLPREEEVDPSGAAGEGYILLADYTDREGEPLVYAGDEINDQTAGLLVDAGISSVRVRRKTGLDNFIALERYSDDNGDPLIEPDEPLSADAVSGLVLAGVTAVRVRRRSNVDPWMVMDSVRGPDGDLIAAAGSYLTEKQITACAVIGRSHIRVAPVTPTEIACAQLCGLGHYRMSGTLDVVPPEKFRAWMDEREAMLRRQGNAGE